MCCDAAVGSSLAEMNSKRGLPHTPKDLPSDKRFRTNASDLFLSNIVSAPRVASLFEDAKLAGTQHISDLATVGQRANSNAHRDLLRKMVKQSRWPKLYYAGIRVRDTRLQAEVVQDVPMVLPHELLDRIGRSSDLNSWSSTEGLSDSAKAHLSSAQRAMGEGPTIVSIGLWIDGTPCNWDRSQSVETFAMSFPGIVGEKSAVRIPFAVMMHRHCITDKTFDDVLAVFVWSLRALVTGVHPQTRHDRAAWRVGEKSRQKQAGHPWR